MPGGAGWYLLCDPSRSHAIGRPQKLTVMKPIAYRRIFTALLLPAGGFALIAVLFYHQAVIQGKIFSARDHYLFFLPRRFFALESLLNGSLPLWNPLNACGVPFLANVQSSVFYPFSVLIYLLPFPGGYCAYVLAHYILAAWCMYALMRHWNSSVFAAAVAGLVFAFGGYMQSINDNLAFLTAAAWLPLIVLCFSRALQQRSLRWILATTLLIGLQVFAGDASFCIVSTMLCAGLYALCSPRAIIAAPLRFRAGVFIAAWCAGLLLAAGVLLPFFEFVRLSDRAAGLALNEALRWSLHPLELLQFIHPYIFGRLVPDVRWFGQRWLDTVYLGIFPLCFAVFYALRGRCPHKRFLAATVLLGLVLALGSYNPALAWIMQTVPALRLMQYPVKFLLLCAFALAVMSGHGADLFIARMRARETIRGLLKPLLLPVCALLALLLAAAASRTQLFDLFVSVYPDTAYFQPLRSDLFFELYRGTFVAALLFGAFGIITWCAIRFKNRPGLLAFFIGCCICADLFFLGAPGDAWLERREIRRPGSVVSGLQHDDSLFRIYSLSRIAGGISYAHTPHLSFDRVYRVLTQTLPPNLHMYYGLASVDEYSEMLNVRYYEVFGRVLLHLAGNSHTPTDSSYCRKIFSMLNVKYILSPHALPELGFELMRDGPVKLYRNQGVWPRAFIARHINVCADDAAVVRRIHAAEFEPLSVVVPQAEFDRLPPLMQSALAVAYPKDLNQCVTVVHYEANRVELSVDTAQHGLLVLSDTWFPGWSVQVNARTCALLRVNHTLRGVALDPGVSRIVFEYRPRSFLVGMALSALTLCCIIMAAFAGILLKRGKPQ